MPFAHMLVIAILIRVAGVESVLGAVELHLVPLPSLGVFDHAALILILTWSGA